MGEGDVAHAHRARRRALVGNVRECGVWQLDLVGTCG